MATKKKRASGPTQPEKRRIAKQVLLRLSPAVRDILRDQSEVQGISVSGLVSELVLRTWGHQYVTADDRSPAQEKNR